MPDKPDIAVFISYGRADASLFVDRLAADLERAGLKVWRDVTQLRSPHAWDDQIQAALKQSDVVVAVLTPHAVRAARQPGKADESVCLDELAFARFSPPPTPIVPILLLPCEPPFVIYRTQYLDFLEADHQQERYDKALTALVRTIDAVKNGAPLSYRTTQFEPLDFDVYLKAKTRDFVGRQWLMDEVFARLQDPKGSRALLLVGEPGWGKSAFAGHLFAANPDGQLLAAHFCRADRKDSINPRRFVESLVAVAAIRIPALQERIAALVSQHEEGLLANGQVVEAFEKLFLEPLARVDPAALGKLPRYLLVDALDEADDSSTELSIGDLLARSLELFPDWLRLVSTTRDNPKVLDAFGSATFLRLERDDARNRADIRTLVTQITGSSAGASEAEPDRDALLEQVAAKAAGNALCAAQLSLALRTSGMDASALRSLPQGLSGLYRSILARRTDPRGLEWAALRQSLEMICATRAPLPITFIAAAGGDSAQYTTRAALEGIHDLLIIHNDEVRLFHQTLADFFAQPDNPFFVNAAQGASRLAAFATTIKNLAALPAPIQEFCGRQIFDWLIQANDAGASADSLAGFYDYLYFSKPPGPVSYYITEVRIEDDDAKLIAKLVAGEKADAVLAVIALALHRADDRFRNSGARPWMQQGGLPRPEDALKLQIERGIQGSLDLAKFALGWVKFLTKIRPDLRPKLRAILVEWDKLRGAFGWLDVAVGYYTLGISAYFEDASSVLCTDWKEIRESLQ